MPFARLSGHLKLVLAVAILCAGASGLADIALAQSNIQARPESLKDVSRTASETEYLDYLQSGEKGIVGGRDVTLGIDALAIREEIIMKLTDHPRLDEARSAICTASFQIRTNKARYYPQMSVSFSGGNKWINKTNRADEFGGTDNPEYDGRGINATLQFRQQIYDWGDTRASINLAKAERSRAVLERLRVMDEQAAAVLRAALEFRVQGETLAVLNEQLAALEPVLESVEARFEAGAGRLTELRQAQIIRITQDSAIEVAEKRREQSLQVLKTQYGISPEEAGIIAQTFLDVRPDIPPVIPPEATLQGRIIGLELQATNYEYNRLEAQRLPRVEGVLTGRAWDINKSNQCGNRVDQDHPDAINRGGIFGSDYRLGQNCHTHEVAGTLELNMPLYDGGANEAQRKEVESRQKGLESRRLAHIRDHESESAYLSEQLNEFNSRYRLEQERAEKLGIQLDSLRAVQGKSQFTPLEVANLQAQVIDAQTGLILLYYQIENIRLEGLLRANALAQSLGLELETSGC